MGTQNSRNKLDLAVGAFMLLGILALLFMVFKVSGINHFSPKKTYQVSADFLNIGGLKVGAPVTVAGVKVGEVTGIVLEPGRLNAKVTMRLDKNKPIPYEDVSARILTEGLLGSNYISIVPGFEDSPAHPYLRSGDIIERTQEAVILENVIGQFLFNVKST